MRLIGIGQVYVWEGASLFIGQSLKATEEHAHHAIQVTAVSAPARTVRFRSADEWIDYPGVIIAPHHPHTFDGVGATVGHIFVEPETPQGRAIRDLYLDKGIVSFPADKAGASARRLFEVWSETQDEGRMIPAAQAVIRELTEGVEPRTVVDERVLRAIAYLKQNLHRAISLEEVAGTVFLSPSRFRHLFVQETGMALRPYLLWLRLMLVWDAIMHGDSVSAAAHRAGFADSAHLTRTCRSMFGITPTSLQREA